MAWSAPALLRLLRAEDDATRRRARFFLTSALLATLPACATFPSGRLMIVPGIGIVGLVAMMAPFLARGHPFSVRSFAFFACSSHLLLAPLLFEMNAHQFHMFQNILMRMVEHVPTDAASTTKRLVIVNPPDTAFAYYFVVENVERGRPTPMRLAVFGPGMRDMRVTREDERTFVVTVEGGFYRAGTELLFRALEEPIPVGTKVKLSDMTIVVSHTNADGAPDEARFTFDKSLADGFVFVAWRGRYLEPWTPPNVGETVTMAAQTPEVF
jgi:hypothetical protein